MAASTSTKAGGDGSTDRDRVGRFGWVIASVVMNARPQLRARRASYPQFE
jgi:hypothetical protein